MPRKQLKHRKTEPNQSYVFEIVDWEPHYSLSLNRDRRDERLYNEYINIQFTGACVFPKPLVGRTAQFHVAGERNFMTPMIVQYQPDWQPRCVGELELRPSTGHFYTSMPIENLGFVLSAFEHSLFRYVCLWGPSLKWSKSLCLSMSFDKAVNFEEL